MLENSDAQIIVKVIPRKAAKRVVLTKILLYEHPNLAEHIKKCAVSPVKHAH